MTKQEPKPNPKEKTKPNLTRTRFFGQLHWRICASVEQHWTGPGGWKCGMFFIFLAANRILSLSRELWSLMITGRGWSLFCLEAARTWRIGLDGHRPYLPWDSKCGPWSLAEFASVSQIFLSETVHWILLPCYNVVSVTSGWKTPL